MPDSGLTDCVDFDGNPAPLEIVFPFTEGTFHSHVVSAIVYG